MRPPRAVAPGLHQILHLLPVQRPRHRPFFAMGDCARCYRRPGLPVLDLGRALERAVAFPGPVGARLAAGVTKLDAGDRALLPDEFDQPPERLDEDVIPDAEIADGTAASPLDLGRL